MANAKVYSSYYYSECFKTEMPSHWKEKQLGYLARHDRSAFVDGPFGSDLKTTDYQDSGVPLIQLNNIRDGKHVIQNTKFITENKKNKLERHIAYPKDIVIAKMAEPVARAAIVNEIYPEYVIVADCVKMTPDTDVINENYLVWAINSDCVRINAELVSTGTTRIRINLSELKKLKIPYPFLSEQSNISDFLDHETAKIDNLIEKQQQLIELLKEKRQAVISHAVTKGLNPDVPMKDSGVEWLGEVPEHWSVIKGGYIGRLFGSEGVLENNISNYGRLPFIKVSTLSVDSFSPSQPEWFIKSPQDKNYKAESGYIVFPKRGAAIFTNKVNIVKENSIIDPNLMGWKMSKGVSEEYIAFVLKKRGLSDIADISTVPQINNKHIAPEKFPLPPHHEQVAIVDYLHMSLSILDELIDQTQKAIIFSQERRTALISAAVTGKIDVRDWVAPNACEAEVSQEVTA